MSDEKASPRKRFDWDRVSHWLTLGANIGVLVGLVLVIMELNQNQIMMRAQARNEIASDISDLLLRQAENPQLNDLIYRIENGEDFSPQELRQYFQYNASLFRHWENAYYQYRMGLYDEAEFVSQRRSMLNRARGSSASRRVWCDIRGYLSEEFVAHMMEQLGPDFCKAAEMGSDDVGR